MSVTMIKTKTMTMTKTQTMTGILTPGSSLFSCFRQFDGDLLFVQTGIRFANLFFRFFSGGSYLMRGQSTWCRKMKAAV